MEAPSSTIAGYGYGCLMEGSFWKLLIETHKYSAGTSNENEQHRSAAALAVFLRFLRVSSRPPLSAHPEIERETEFQNFIIAIHSQAMCSIRNHADLQSGSMAHRN